MAIEKIFPINISVQKDCLSENDFTALKNRIEELYEGCPDSFMQTTGDFHEEPAAKPLVEFLLTQGLREIAIESGFIMSPLVITNMWVNRYMKDAEIHNHIHSNSLLSGVFYFDEIGGTIFNNPVGDVKDMVKEDFVVNTMSNSNSMTIASKKNTLVIFPSWIRHGSVPNPTDTPRYSLSFNCVTENLGQDGTFNRLNLQHKK